MVPAVGLLEVDSDRGFPQSVKIISQYIEISTNTRSKNTFLFAASLYSCLLIDVDSKFESELNVEEMPLILPVVRMLSMFGALVSDLTVIDGMERAEKNVVETKETNKIINPVATESAIS